MATYTETIELEDKVTPAAEAAQASLADLGRGLDSVNKTLASTGAPGGGTLAPAAAPPGGRAMSPEEIANPIVREMPAPVAVAQPEPAGGFGAGQQAPMGPIAGEHGPPIGGAPGPDDAAKFAAAGQAAQQYGNDLQKVGQAAVDSGKAAHEGGRSHGEMWQEAVNAATEGQAVIGEAMAGVKAAFVSLKSGDVEGAIEGITDGLAGVAKGLDMLVPGLGEVASYAIKIAGGFAAVTAGLVQEGMQFAVESNQAKTSMIAMFDALGGGKIKGEEVNTMLSEMSDQIGISKESLVPLTQSFMKMGVTGKAQLEDLTKAAISAQAIMRDPSGAMAFETLTKKVQAAAQTTGTIKLDARMIRSLGDAGLTVDDLAKGLGKTAKEMSGTAIDAKKLGDVMTQALIKKGAGPLENLGNTFAEIKKKFMASIGEMFEDIDVGPFMKEVRSLFDIFGQSTASGQAMKAGIGGFFKEAFATATKLVPLVKHFLLDLVIWGLKAYISIKPIEKSFVNFIRSATGAKVIHFIFGALLTVFKAVAIAVGVIVAAFAVLATGIGIIMGVGLALWTIVMNLIGLFVGSLMDAIDGVVTGFGSLGDGINDMISGALAALGDWASEAITAAENFVQGLVSGITNGAGMVVDAVKNLAGGAVDAFTGALGIKSPSKVMIEHGLNIGQGVVSGLESSGPDVHGAASEMASMAAAGVSSAPAATAASPPFASTASSASSSSSGGSGGVSINIEQGAIQINGAGKDVEAISAEMVAGLMEELAMQAGLA